MRLIGMALWIGGLLVLAWAVLGIDPSVAVEGSPERVNNLGLQQQQMIAVLTGLSAFVAGVIVQALAEVTERLKPEGLATGRNVRDEAAPSELLRGEDESIEAMMGRYGITRDGEKFVFQTFRYDRAADAIAYARRQGAAPTP